MKKVFALFATICIMIIGLVTPTFAVNIEASGEGANLLQYCLF